MKKRFKVITVCLAIGLLLAGGAEIHAETEETANAAASEAPVVYFTSDISAEGLVRIYEALGWTPEGNVAVKISTGEPPASNYLHPELIGDLEIGRASCRERV